MHVLIDKSRCLFLGKHESENALTNLAWLQSPHVATSVLKCDNPFELNSLTDFELKHLYKNTTGVDHMGFSRDALLSVVHEVLTRMDELDIDANEIRMQADSVHKDEPYMCYRYVKGSFTPEKISDIFEPDGVKLARNLESENAAIAAAPVVKQAYDAIAPALVRHSTPSGPRTSAPRVQSEGPAEAPKFGSKTGRVWEIANAIYAQYTPPIADFKALRRQIVEACEAEGINSSTASVQYGKWKQNKV